MIYLASSSDFGLHTINTGEPLPVDLDTPIAPAKPSIPGPLWNAAEHEKNAVYSRNGKYKFYLCPEAIPVLNEFAAKEGKHFTWESKEWADKKGYEYQYLDQQGCIDNLEHIQEIRIMEHEADYSCSPAYILGDMYSYDWYDFFDGMKKDAPSHWEILMRLASKGAVSVVIYKNPDGDGVSVAIK